MSPWSEPSFVFESPSLASSDGTYGQILVELSCYASGSYEEPMLEQDSDPLLSLNGVEVRITDLPPEEQKALHGAIDRELDSLTEAYFSEISQHLAEVAADAYHDAMEDR
jgi:hypothetical protein